MSYSPDDEEERKRWIILHKIVDHAWNGHDSRSADYRSKHQQEFIDKGIRTQAELFDIVREGIEGKATRAFREETNEQRKRVLGKEIFSIPLRDATGQSFDLFVAVNPDMRVESGRQQGGSCFIPKQPDYFDTQVKEELAKRQPAATTTLEAKDLVVTGGRPALKEQDSQRQIVEVQPNRQNDVKEPERRETYMERMQRLNPITEEQLATERQRQEQLRQERDRSRDGTREREWKP